MWETIVVGMQYHNTQLNFTVDEKTERRSDDSPFVRYEVENMFTFRREPNNKYDKNAIQVLMDGNMIGYIPRETASEISPKIDSGLVIY